MRRFYRSLFGGAYDTIFILQSVVAFIYIMNYHFGLRIKLFFLGNRYENLQNDEQINSTESSNNIAHTSDFNSSQLKRVFKEY
jgi:hypothetical protein